MLGNQLSSSQKHQQTSIQVVRFPVHFTLKTSNKRQSAWVDITVLLTQVLSAQPYSNTEHYFKRAKGNICICVCEYTQSHPQAVFI